MDVDANAVHAIEAVCFDEPWSVAAIESSLANPEAVCFVEEGGYIIGMKLGDDYELFRMAVLPEFRGKGAATRLMRKFLEKCGGDVFLEVSSGNIPAIALYKKFGFAEINRRKNYYGGGDGVVMRRGGKIT
ncbi:MAG: GNAT family N-acetyltransferase [Oscillospiraceae bacterium]|jgi:ribosomal-protein-alanine N-acetyltransferase|nr:GNAT family N-acetyltransferase [Oscillospiraceae bacterium]